ncbi:rhomboid family intramembrane serine protease [Streptococcus gallolyticus]|nr:rhomboid family intramembrane serine protease [Streptococcus gallolyticus]MBY5041513.1 rhomboid family intramembrane serine protease [Streptococcus gallolyticus]
MNQVFKRDYPVTNCLLGITTLVFLAMQILRFGQATSSQTIFDFGGLFGLAVRQDVTQIWRLLTPIFVHIGWEHFLFNGFTHLIFGYEVEDIFGPWRFLALYLLSGLMGNVFVFYFTPDVVAAGASSSLFGLFGVMAVLRYQSRSAYVRFLGQRYVGLLIANLIVTFISPNISIAGHIGGLIGGAFCAFMLVLPREPWLFTKGQRLLVWLAYVGLALILIFLAIK